MSETDTVILRALEDATTVGITTKQIASKTGYDESAIYRILHDLLSRGKVTVVGRKLWILKRYVELASDSDFISPEWYTNQFKKTYDVKLDTYEGKITFAENGGKRIHRWSPYVQGFSSGFVEKMLDKYKIGRDSCVLDPFVGSGTVLVSARLHGASSIGVELMPLLAFVTRVKTNWDPSVHKIKSELEKLKTKWQDGVNIPKPFLRETSRQFESKVLTNLLRLKQSLETVQVKSIRELLLLAFASILVDCSQLKRAPCLGYVKKKVVPHDAPFTRFAQKVNDMIDDLIYVQEKQDMWGTPPIIIEADSAKVEYEQRSIDLAITSPPYVNGMDYVINYKIEMVWLDMMKSYEELSKLKGKMVACDNVPKQITHHFALKKKKYSDDWLDEIIANISRHITQKENYRRNDMHLIVHKYFDDLYPVMQNVYNGLKRDGKFILVVGDSLIAGTYIPTDLLIAKMGKKVGFEIENIQVARSRRSGQRHSFRLRESIITLVKG